MRALGFLAVFGLLFASGCASPPELRSAPPRTPLVVDGAYADWAGRFTPIGDGRSVGLAVGNTDGDLYLCLVSRDLGVGRLLEKTGLRLWIDPAGGTRRALGLRFAPAEIGPEKASTPSVEVVFDGAEYGFQLAELSAEGPVDARVAQHADVVVYEIRVALGRPWVASGTEASQVTLRRGAGAIGVGFESGDAGKEEGAIAPLRAWASVTLD